MDRKYVLIIGLAGVAVVLLVQLLNLQIFSKEYKINAENNAYKYVTSYPARGIIYDRNHNILVTNKNTYDVLVTPYEVEEFDTLALCRIFNLESSFVKEKFMEYKEKRRSIGYQSLTFLKQISGETFNIFSEHAFEFPGFSTLPRTSRSYPFSAGANLFGYINEVDADFLKKNPKYKRGDYVGVTGLERSYEDILGGTNGYTIYLRDVHNRVQSHFAGGAYDKLAIPGEDITTTIDGYLQQYGEKLMRNKVGSLVAIEPSTGEILTLVSSPGIEIEKLADIRNNYNEILNDPYKPMFNRAVMSAYPPGSVFKLVNGLIGLQEGVVATETRYPCSMGFPYGNRKLGCHAHPSPLDFTHAIMTSCNAYFCYVFVNLLKNKRYSSIEEAFEKWLQYLRSFGFGEKLGSDFPSELGGSLPSAARYDRLYGKGRWTPYSVISLAIGQGELGTTPLHLANLAATIANRGFYYIPHLVKSTSDSLRNAKYSQRHYTMVDTTNFCKVIEGMWLAVNSRPGEGGTASRTAQVPGLDICGKTGTAQNPHGKDNSVFICFAPRDNPKIAVAAYLENAGFGGTWAAPIASLLVEKYLNGETSRPQLEESIMQSNLMMNVPVKR